MIKFFRKIRQKLLISGKMQKYFTYAFGEIILVVIGILIALQINNWNEDRKQDRASLEICKRLYQENLSNIKALAAESKRLQKSMIANISVLQLMGKDYTTKKKIVLDSLINDILILTTFNYKSAVLTEAVSSGKLAYIKNDNLKNKIYELLPMLERVVLNENAIRTDFAENLTPFLYKNYSLRQMDFNLRSFKTSLGKSVFEEMDGRNVLNNFEFENLLDNAYFVRNVLKKRYEDLMKRYKEIEKLLETEISK